MRLPSKEIVERIRRQYPVGCRVELLRMDDVQDHRLEQGAQ